MSHNLCPWTPMIYSPFPQSFFLSLSLAPTAPQAFMLSFQIAPITDFFGWLLILIPGCHPISDINMKWRQCQKGSHSERSRPSFFLLFFFLNISCFFWHIWVVPFEFDWTQASPQIPIQPAVPLSLSFCLSEIHSNTGSVKLLRCQNYEKRLRTLHCCHGNK